MIMSKSKKLFYAMNCQSIRFDSCQQNIIFFIFYNKILFYSEIPKLVNVDILKKDKIAYIVIHLGLRRYMSTFSMH